MRSVRFRYVEPAKGIFIEDSRVVKGRRSTRWSEQLHSAGLFPTQRNGLRANSHPVDDPWATVATKRVVLVTRLARAKGRPGVASAAAPTMGSKHSTAGSSSR
jgi:hypothetical protein